MALRGFVLATRFPAAVEPGESSRPFLVVAHALASAARGAQTVFGWVLKLVAERGLVKGWRIGVERDSGESYRAMLTRMARGAVRRRRPLMLALYLVL